MEAFAEHFPVALGELLEEAMASTHADDEVGGAVEPLGLVDLS
jgi:hypothetical protein